jgi:hypothetical protein
MPASTTGDQSQQVPAAASRDAAIYIRTRNDDDVDDDAIYDVYGARRRMPIITYTLDNSMNYNRRGQKFFAGFLVGTRTYWWEQWSRIT